MSWSSFDFADLSFVGRWCVPEPPGTGPAICAAFVVNMLWVSQGDMGLLNTKFSGGNTSV